MMKRARLIYNPSAGREEMKKRLPDVLQRLEQAGIETSTYATTAEGDATREAAQAIERGYDYIIGAGGDGTLHEIVNGMSEKLNRPPLGILPLGTTNDFARALNIPKNWEKACDLIAKQYTTSIDIGKVNDRYFINILGGGSMTELTYEVPSKLKTMIGQLAYYMKGLEKLPRLSPIDVHIKTAEKEYREEAMVFLISNSHSVGGLEKLSPGASLHDGLLDVLVLKKCNLAEFLRIVTLALRGEHIHDPHVFQFQTKYLEIYSSDRVQLNLDGEYGGTLPVKISTLQNHIKVIVDESGKSIYKKNVFDGLIRPFVQLALENMKSKDLPTSDDKLPTIPGKSQKERSKWRD
jgi:diacylglycerol kinase (ATP)